MSRDLDNLWKALLDLLAKRAGIIPGDNSATIQALGIELGPEAERAGVVVTIEPWPRADGGGRANRGTGKNN
jgi:Holliday junction resolvase RusA-like endonuclease